MLEAITPTMPAYRLFPCKVGEEEHGLRKLAGMEYDRQTA